MACTTSTRSPSCSRVLACWLRGTMSRLSSTATRLPAAVASHLHTFTAAELASADLDQWRIVRTRGEQRRWPRVLGRRFRQDPEAYLQALEERLIKLSLPP